MIDQFIKFRISGRDEAGFFALVIQHFSGETVLKIFEVGIVQFDTDFLRQICKNIRLQNKIIIPTIVCIDTSGKIPEKTFDVGIPRVWQKTDSMREGHLFALYGQVRRPVCIVKKEIDKVYGFEDVPVDMKREFIIFEPMSLILWEIQ